MIKIRDPRLYANCIRMYEWQYYYFRMICVDEIMHTSPFASFSDAYLWESGWLSVANENDSRRFSMYYDRVMIYE